MTSSQQTRRLVRMDAVVCAGLFLVVMWGGFLRGAPGVCGVFHDDGIYVACGEALASGDGYRLTNVPGTPPQTKYPILYPAMLAVAWQVWPAFPENLFLIQGMSLFCGWGGLAIGYLYLVHRGYCVRSVALLASILTATSATYLYYSTTAMSEMPFTLVLFAALWATEVFLERPEGAAERGPSGACGRLDSRSFFYFAIGILLGIPFLIRSIGFIVIPAALGVARLQGRPLMWIALGATTTVAPWILWSTTQTQLGEPTMVSYYTDYVDCYQSGGVALMGRVCLTNSLQIAYWTTGLAAEGLVATVKYHVGAGWWVAGVVGLGIMTWLHVVRDLLKGRLLPTFLILYAGVLLVWSWPPLRFLVPLQLILAVYTIQVGAGFFSSLQARSPYSAKCLATTLLTAVLVGNGLLLAYHHRITDRHGYPFMGYCDSEVDWGSYQKLFRWLHNHARPTDSVACGLDSMVSLYTGLSAVRPFAYRPANLFYGEDPDRWLTSQEFINRLTALSPQYLVDTPMPGFAEYPLFHDALRTLAAEHPRWIEQVYVGEDDRFVVYRLNSRFEPDR